MSQRNKDEPAALRTNDDRQHTLGTFLSTPPVRTPRMQPEEDEDDGSSSRQCLEAEAIILLRPAPPSSSDGSGIDGASDDDPRSERHSTKGEAQSAFQGFKQTKTTRSRSKKLFRALLPADDRATGGSKSQSAVEESPGVGGDANGRWEEEELLLPGAGTPALSVHIPVGGHSPAHSIPASTARKPPYTILTVQDGCVSRCCYTASQLLREVHKACPMPKVSAGTSGQLRLRDLRQICSGISVGSQRPSIEPRRTCLLINITNVRAILLHNKVMLIVPENSRTSVGEGCTLKQSLDSPRISGSKKLDQRALSESRIGRDGFLACTRHFPTTFARSSNNLQQPLLQRSEIYTSPSRLFLPDEVMSENSTTTEVEEPTNFDEEYDDEMATTAGPHQYESALVKKLVRLSALKRAGIFEFMALEAILFEVIVHLNDSILPACEMAESYKRSNLHTLSSTESLHQIRELKKFLQESAGTAEGISNCIAEILEDEEDIRRLELSRFYMNPEDWDVPTDSPGAEDAEILLESYQQDIEAVVQKVQKTEENLDTILQIMQLQLATTRTYLLKFEIALQVISVAFGFVSAIGGIFGMNIRNGFEDRKDLFWTITKILLGLIILAIVTVGWVSRRIKL